MPSSRRRQQRVNPLQAVPVEPEPEIPIVVQAEAFEETHINVEVLLHRKNTLQKENKKLVNTIERLKKELKEKDENSLKERIKSTATVEEMNHHLGACVGALSQAHRGGTAAGTAAAAAPSGANTPRHGMDVVSAESRAADRASQITEEGRQEFEHKSEIVRLKLEIKNLVQKEDENSKYYHKMIEEARNENSRDFITMENEITSLLKENNKLRERLSQSTKYLLKSYQKTK